MLAHKAWVHLGMAPPKKASDLFGWDVGIEILTLRGGFEPFGRFEDGCWSGWGAFYPQRWKLCVCPLGATDLSCCFWRERCHEHKPILHSDNGGPMKSVTLRHKLLDLGVTSSFSRPRVSDDNAFIESLFRTLKHGPIAPPKRFASIEQARTWVATFMRWYNTELSALAQLLYLMPRPPFLA